jgi:alkylation response protein AidB-like acyl-CoA dehydrogenase
MDKLIYDDLLFNMEQFIDWERIAEINGGDNLKDEYLMTLQSVAQFCEKNVIPVAEEIDHEGCDLVEGEKGKKEVKVPEKMLENLNRLKSMGLFCGTTLPENSGGFGFALTSFFAIGELFSMADSSIGLSPMLQEGCALVINEFANDTIRKEYLPKLISGERICGMGLTEPNAGSDLSVMTTVAEPVGDDESKRSDRVKELEKLGDVYLVSGTKIFITNGFGDILTLAKVNGEISMVLVMSEDKEVTRVEHKLGISGSPTCELYFDNSPGVMIGGIGDGLVPNMIMLMYIARMGTATQGLGIGQAAHQMAKNYATNERVQFGVPIVEHPPVRQILYENEVDLQATRALIYYAAFNFDMKEAMKKKMKEVEEGSPEHEGLKKKLRAYSKITELLVCLSKYDGAELGNRVANSSLQVFGGNGFTRDYPMERYYRDVRITNIYEGTSQIQLDQIFNESFYSEKVALINQYKMGGNTSFVETETNKLFFDRFMDDYRDEILKNSNGKKIIRELLPVVDQMRRELKEVRESLFIREREKGKDAGRKYNGIYQRDYADILGGIIKSYLLLRQATISEKKEITARSFISRMSIRAEYLKRKIRSGIDDLVNSAYARLME